MDTLVCMKEQTYCKVTTIRSGRSQGEQNLFSTSKLTNPPLLMVVIMTLGMAAVHTIILTITIIVTMVTRLVIVRMIV